MAKAQKQGQDQERGQEAGTGGRRQGQEEDCADLLDLELKRGREGTPDMF